VLSDLKPSTLPHVAAALGDLIAWHGHVLVRAFYPDAAPGSANLALPNTITSLELVLTTERVLSTEEAKRLTTAIMIVRDAGAALAAVAVTGRLPDYDSFVAFQKYYSDLTLMMQDIRARLGGSSSVAVEQEGAFEAALDLDAYEETPLQRLLREQGGNKPS
jgi:hypothetical protein